MLLRVSAGHDGVDYDLSLVNGTGEAGDGGIPLDSSTEEMTGEIHADLGIDDFAVGRPWRKC